MGNYKKMLPYLLICAVVFFFLPIIGKNTGDYMLILLVVTPIVCFLVSFSYGYKHGWSLLFPVIVGALFVPTIFIHFNSSALVYVFGYAIISAVAIYIGELTGKRQDNANISCKRKPKNK